LSADLVDRGLVMAGGGALLRGIDRLVAEETGLPVHIADDPLSAVAEGTGRVCRNSNFSSRSQPIPKVNAPRVHTAICRVNNA